TFRDHAQPNGVDPEQSAVAAFQRGRAAHCQHGHAYSDRRCVRSEDSIAVQHESILRLSAVNYFELDTPLSGVTTGANSANFGLLTGNPSARQIQLNGRLSF